MTKFEALQSKTVVLPIDNIDTDQIIPARYLKSISKEGLGEGLGSRWGGLIGQAVEQRSMRGANGESGAENLFVFCLGLG